MSYANTNAWTFDLSSFMVLLGEDEEMNYRLMQRSIYELLSAAPAAGLQNYLRSFSPITETVGQTYISQSGGHNAPLRNMRLANTITTRHLLADSKYTIYHIPPSQVTGNNWKDIGSLIWMLITWIVVGGVIITLVLLPQATWIGFTNCILLPVWSMALRFIDQKCSYIAQSSPSQPLWHDSIVILGRRNSCFVLEGSREDINRWTGVGIEIRKSAASKAMGYFARLGTLLILIFIFISIPNGTVHDQVSFITINILGQINVKMGRFLNARSCLWSLENVTNTKVPSRTHVYGLLLKKFGNGEWVQLADLLPKTPVWDAWQKQVVDSEMDPKELYAKLAQEHLETNAESKVQSHIVTEMEMA